MEFLPNRKNVVYCTVLYCTVSENQHGVTVDQAKPLQHALEDVEVVLPYVGVGRRHFARQEKWSVRRPILVVYLLRILPRHDVEVLERWPDALMETEQCEIQGPRSYPETLEVR